MGKKSDDNAIEILKDAFDRLDLSVDNPDEFNPKFLKKSEKKSLEKEIKSHLTKIKPSVKVVSTNAGDSRLWCDAFVMFCCGESRKGIARKLKVDHHTVASWCKSQDWDNLKKTMVAKIQQQIADKVGQTIAVNTTKMLDLLLPVVNELGAQAAIVVKNKGLDDKEIMKFFHDFSKLTGQFSGELADNKNITIGPNQAYAKIMEMGSARNISNDGFRAEVMEVPKLIE